FASLQSRAARPDRLTSRTHRPMPGFAKAGNALGASVSSGNWVTTAPTDMARASPRLLQRPKPAHRSLSPLAVPSEQRFHEYVHRRKPCRYTRREPTRTLAVVRSATSWWTSGRGACRRGAREAAEDGDVAPRQGG